MAYDLTDLGPGLREFLTERHLTTLTTLRADGSPHVVPVGVTFDADTRTARAITSGTSAKARHEGHAGMRYARCYRRRPRVNPARVVIEISVDRILGNM